VTTTYPIGNNVDDGDKGDNVVKCDANLT